VSTEVFALLESLSDAFLIIDRQWRITYANPVALAPIGAPAEEVVGRDLWERFPVLAGSPTGAAYRRAMKERVPVQIEDQGAFSGNWYEVIVHPLTEGIAVYARDISKRKRAEDAAREAERALQEANRRKDNFLAMLAHELRNPLAPIRNAAQVLRMAGLDPDRLERARSMIDRQVAHMSRLIDDLLDVSRISQGKILIRKEPVDLAALARATAEDHRPLFEGAGLALVLELPDRPLWMDGDPTRLSQALGNLLQNAIKFTNPEGRVTVRLAEHGDAAELTVEDTGVGMEPEILARLFQPFSQADQTLDRSRGGLGLGLALVKGLVEMHGGSVEAVSGGAGRGSALTLRLPLQARESAPAPGEAATPEAKTLRVLIIEDNQDAADSLQILLELSGHRAEVAYTGKDGLDASRRQPPQVVLCDIGLPGGMNGYDVARGLRAELPDIHLIALTGYAQEEDQRRAREAGFDRHLTKPVDPTALIRLLGEMSQA
jgi:PAS domain S-box-containing protein